MSSLHSPRTEATTGRPAGEIDRGHRHPGADDDPAVARCRCGWEYAIGDSGDVLVALVSHLSVCAATARRPNVTWAGLGGGRPSV